MFVSRRELAECWKRQFPEISKLPHSGRYDMRKRLFIPVSRVLLRSGCSLLFSLMRLMFWAKELPLCAEMRNFLMRF